jgi:hypothetical protein
MKKAKRIISDVLLFILAFSPIFFLGYLLGIKLLEN